jgi:Na+/H+-dicarboxylate symporter
MTGTSGTRKTLRLFIAMVTLAGAVAFLAVSLTRPVPVANASLGAEWQCHKTAFILTTCRRTVPTEPVVKTSQHRICWRQA